MSGKDERERLMWSVLQEELASAKVRMNTDDSAKAFADALRMESMAYENYGRSVAALRERVPQPEREPDGWIRAADWEEARVHLEMNEWYPIVILPKRKRRESFTTPVYFGTPPQDPEATP